MFQFFYICIKFGSNSEDILAQRIFGRGQKCAWVGLMTESVAMDMEGPIGAEEAIEDHDGTAADLELWCQQGEIPSLKNYCPARKGLKRYSIWNVQV